MGVIYQLSAFLKYNFFRMKWKRIRGNNFTRALNVFDINDVVIGRGTYGGLRIYTDVKGKKLKIGNYCSIAANVVFMLGLEHRMDKLSTYPFMVKLLKIYRTEAVSKGDIIVDDDVWIGYGATILSGVHIGQGAVIAAGAVVTKDIPPYAIAAGVPAKVMKYRFNEKLIEELLKVDFGKLDEGMVREHIDDLYEKLEHEGQISWMPKKEERKC